MKKLLLLLIFFPFLSFSQNISGTIISQKDNLPLEDTNIFALSSKTGTITNKNGEFSIKLLSKYKDNEILEFSHVGYVTKRLTLNYLIKHKYKISLEEKVENLSDVVITSSYKLKPKVPFHKLNSSKYAVFSFGSFLKDDKIYVIGGDASFEADVLERIRSQRADFTLTTYLENPNYYAKLSYYRREFSIYDIKTDTWEYPKLDLKLQKRAYHNIHYYNNSIYVLGGKRTIVNQKSTWEYLQDQIEVIDLNNKTVKVDNTNPHQAADFASFSYKDNIIVMGGSVKSDENGKKVYSSKVHLYNISSGYWYELDDMSSAKETTGIVIDDKIYIIGGNNGKPVSQIESFDLNTQTWQTEGQLFSGLEKPALSHHDNIIYIYEDQLLYTFDLKTKQLKEYETELALKYAAMHFDNNKLYIIGGRSENKYTKTPSADVFSINIEDFKNTNITKAKVLSKEINLAKVD
ncbi:carboxypeptidase-like regulatory domain-containing protein [Flavobacterium sp. CGRL1]